MIEKYFKEISATDITNLFNNLDANMQTIKTVYHYTTKNAFYNIISDGSLRLSNIRRMNDPLEIKFGISVINHYLQQRDRIDIISFISNMFENSITGEIPFYVISTSEDNDTYQQWINYSEQGKGINIGFDRMLLFELISLNKENRLVYIYPVIYFNDSYDLIENRISDFIEIVLSAIIRMYDNAEFSKSNEYKNELFSLILLFASLIKNDFHKHELEWRYLVITNKDDTKIVAKLQNGEIKTFFEILFAHKNSSQFGSNNFRDKYGFITNLKLGPNIRGYLINRASRESRCTQGERNLKSCQSDIPSERLFFDSC